MTDTVEDWELAALERAIRERRGRGYVRVEPVSVGGREFLDVDIDGTILDFRNIASVYSWLDESAK